MTPDFYKTIAQPATAEFRDRGSRFIAYAYPVKDIPDCKNRLAELKAAHPKAVHHCFAWRLGADGQTFRASDDGEPSGTAGRPILGQIDSLQLTHTMVVVVRYFGGTLLGVPGLIHAYKTVTREALQSVPVVEQPVLEHYRLQFDYTRMNEVMRVLKQQDCPILRQEMQLFCMLETGIPRRKLAVVLEQFREMQGVEVEKLNGG